MPLNIKDLTPRHIWLYIHFGFVCVLTTNIFFFVTWIILWLPLVIVVIFLWPKLEVLVNSDFIGCNRNDYLFGLILLWITTPSWILVAQRLPLGSIWNSLAFLPAELYLAFCWGQINIFVGLVLSTRSNYWEQKMAKYLHRNVYHLY